MVAIIAAVKNHAGIAPPMSRFVHGAVMAALVTKAPHNSLWKSNLGRFENESPN